jgi:hypothetical protein
MRRGLLVGAVFLLFFTGAAAARADDGGTDGATSQDDAGAVGDAGCPAPDDAGLCPTDLIKTNAGSCAASGSPASPGGALLLLLVAGVAYASFAFRNSRSL